MPRDTSRKVGTRFTIANTADHWQPGGLSSRSAEATQQREATAEANESKIGISSLFIAKLRNICVSAGIKYGY